MEDVLDLYAEAYDPQRPVVCFNESPHQLIRETRTPLPVKRGLPHRYDYEYKREGSCNLFLTVEPWVGWHHVEVTAQRIKQDFAHQMRALVDVHFPQATVIRLVVDNFNTHSPAALYETFEPAEARRLTHQLEFHYTPKHGSWLNMARLRLASCPRSVSTAAYLTWSGRLKLSRPGKSLATQPRRPSTGVSPRPPPAISSSISYPS